MAADPIKLAWSSGTLKGVQISHNPSVRYNSLWMARTHYEVLGVGSKATADQIRSAYRRLVLQHHPDKTSDPRSKQIFLDAANAYEIIGNAEKRRQYDTMLDMQAQRRAQVAAKAAQPPPSTSSSKPAPSVASELTKLSLLFSRGQMGDAEKLARRIIQRDSRQAIPYAILGDVARSRGHVDEATRHYALAIQMDPANLAYQRRYDELINASRPRTTTGGAVYSEAQAPAKIPLVLAGTLFCGQAAYLLLANEPPIAPDIAPIATWTLGLCVMLFLSGVLIGTALSSSGLLDRFYMATSSTNGRTGPAVALATVSIVNFWAAAVLYGLVVLFMRGGHYSVSRLMGSVAVATVVLALAAAIPGQIDLGQVLLWGGNVAYIGGLCGWMVADAFRR